PFTYEQAVKSPYARQWLAAMGVELQSMDTHGVWEKVPLSSVPAGKQVVGCRWVFDLKHDDQGNPVRYKARLVAKGFTQRPGMDFMETAAPTCRPESVRALLALACLRNWDTRHIDVKTAFLNGELEEEIYMQQPPGFAENDDVCRLRRAIYGLKQAGRCWYLKLRAVLESLGFHATAADRCVFVRVKDGMTCILAVHVDDMMLVGDSAAIDSAVKSLADKFTITDLGEVRWFLGMRI
ncbi:reverse transcriptase, partial [Auricularia subglabra TFB-10046 SS5]